MKKSTAAAKTTRRTRSGPASSESPAWLIDSRISELLDSGPGIWRGELLAKIRTIIKSAVPEVIEEWKWNVPVWSHTGIICTGETYKNAVKLTFPKGAALADPSRLFNSSLEGNTRRAIDFHDGYAINETALKTLLRAAAALNISGVDSAAVRPAKPGTRATRTSAPAKKVAPKPKAVTRRSKARRSI